MRTGGGWKKNLSLEIQNMMEWKQNRKMHFTTQRGSSLGKWFGTTASTVWRFPPQQGTLPSLKEADKVRRPTSTPSMTEVSRGTRPGFLQQLFICISVASRSTSPRLEHHQRLCPPQEKTELLQLLIQVGINRKIRLTEKHQNETGISKLSVQCVNNQREDYEIWRCWWSALPRHRNPVPLKDISVLPVVPWWIVSAYGGAVSSAEQCKVTNDPC